VVAGATFAPNDEGERLRSAGYALYRRTAEAMTCCAALDQVMAAEGDQPGTGTGAGTAIPMIFLGDLNDEPLAATTQVTKAQQAPRSTSDLAPGFGPVTKATATGCGTCTGSCHQKAPTTPGPIEAAVS
jgi:hypothetical protein